MSVRRSAATVVSGMDFGFLARAALLMALLYAAYYYPYSQASWVSHTIAAYLALQARAAAALIALFDGGVSATGTTISGRFPLQIVKSCSSLDAQALYVAAVLALPARWSRKALGLVAGIAALNALNLLRIASLYFIGAYTPLAFDTLHEEVLPLVLLIVTCTMFVVWTRWAAGSRAAATV